MSSIIVRGIKTPTTGDKLTIHFQKQKNNGGDVDSVIFPLNANEPHAAVIIFDEEETADSVLQMHQVFNGRRLNVTKEYRVFSKCTMTFDRKSLEHLLNDGKTIEGIMEEIKTAVPEVQIKDSKSSGLIMSANSWYHVQMVKELIQEMHKNINDDVTAGCSTTPNNNPDQEKARKVVVRKTVPNNNNNNCANVSTPTNNVKKEEMASPSRLERENKKKVGEKIYTIVDEDVLMFLLEFKSKEIEEIKSTNHVTLKYQDPSACNSIRVTITSAGAGSTPSRARDQLLLLLEKVQNLEDFQHEVVEVKNFLPSFNQSMSLIAAINSAREYYCQVYIGHRADPHQPTVSFLSSYKGQAEYAMKWFEEIFSRFKCLKATAIDVNVYGFVKQTKPMTLLSFERESSVRIVEVEEDDLFAVILLPQDQSDDVQIQTKVQRFEKLMKDIENDVVFWNCQLEIEGHKESVVDQIERFQINHKGIFIRRSKKSNSKRATFTGSNLDALKEAARKLNSSFQ